MRLLDVANDRPVPEVALYLSKSEALRLISRLEELLADPEEYEHFHMYADYGDWALRGSLITNKKLAELARYSKVEQELLQGDWGIDGAPVKQTGSESTGAPVQGRASRGYHFNPAQQALPPDAIYSDFKSFFEGFVVMNMLLTRLKPRRRVARKPSRKPRIVARFRFEDCVWAVPEGFNEESVSVAHALMTTRPGTRIFVRVSDKDGREHLELAPELRENPGGPERNFRFDLD